MRARGIFMDRPDVIAGIARCDRSVAEARAILLQIEAGGPELDEDQELYRKILRDRIDTHLDLRNFYGRATG